MGNEGRGGNQNMGGGKGDGLKKSVPLNGETAHPL